MKHILTIIILLACLNTHAQLTKQNTSKLVTVSEVKGFGYFIASLNYKVTEGDTTYAIFFRNMKYQTLIDLQVIEFKSIEGTANQFYELLTGILNDKEVDYKETVTLGDTQIIITKQKSMGVQFLHLFTTKGYFDLNKKQIDKLFGKNQG